MVSKKIFPTITTDNAHEYRQQMEMISSYADGVHIDFSDNVFAPTKMLPPMESWRIEGVETHAHVMCQKPMLVIQDLVNLAPDIVILHVESDAVAGAINIINDNSIGVGLAILPDTKIERLLEIDVKKYVKHILVFGGHLGYQGGNADLSQLEKVKVIKRLYPNIEIGWDGGINDSNISRLSSAGVSVFNIGGFLKKSEHPQITYKMLKTLL